MTDGEQELRRALDSRSGAPSPDFRARLRAALADGRPRPDPTLAIALIVILVLTAASIVVIVPLRGTRTHVAMASGARNTATGTRLVSPPAITSPMPSPPIILPTAAYLSAPSANVLWAAFPGEARIFLSTDQGTSWSERSLPERAPLTPQVSFADGLNGWALYGDPASECMWADARLWRTSDGAVTWELVSQVDSTHEKAGGIRFERCKGPIYLTDANHGFVVAEDRCCRPSVYRTADAGQTWATSTLPDPPDFTTHADFSLQVDWIKQFGATLYLKAHGEQPVEPLFRHYIFRSTDAGASWEWLTKVPALDTVMVTETRWIELDLPGQSMESVDGGQQWHTFQCDYAQAAPIAPQVVFGDPSVGYATARGEIQRTLDGGRHWADIKTPGT